PVRGACASAPQVHEACGAGRRFSPSGSRDMKTLGHVHSSSLMLRLASHHLAAFLQLIGQMKTHPLARRLAAGLAVRPAPHIPLPRNVRCC
ncbi:MAG: hypothetical protein WC406_13000, partial [Methanoregula sp.]